MHYFIVICFFQTVWAQCPKIPLKDPCICFSTRYEAVNIVCNGGESLSTVLDSIASASPKMDSLTISNTPIETMPGYAFQGLLIRKLIIRNNGLRNFHPHSFSGSIENTLEELEIRGNLLEKIPQAGVSALQQLKILNLPNNLIEYVHDNAFLSYHSREKLKSLDLSANNLSAVHPTGFLGLDNLTQLSLDKNSISVIPSKALENVQSLEELSLSVNRIYSISTNAFPLPNLRTLSLEVNQIRSFSPDCFAMTPKLSFLYLGNNYLRDVDSMMFYHITGLKILSLNNNKDITKIKETALENIPSLIRLELSDCSIAHIEQGAFQNSLKLQVVILSGNNLVRISHHTFSNLTQLTTIDLSGNSISAVDDYAFSQLSMLITLDLSNNRLESLPKNVINDSFVVKNAKRVLRLQNNPWKCDKELIWLRQWLRENTDVIITSSDFIRAKCWTPSNVNGLDLRQTDSQFQTKKQSTNEPNQKAIDTFSTAESKRMTVFRLPHSEINGLALVGTILGIILVVFVSCIILGYLMRFLFVTSETKQIRYQSSGRSDEKGGSAIGCNGSSNLNIYGQQSTANTNVFMNRPRHWWF